MTRYSVQTRDRIFVKGDGYLSFAKNTVKDIGKNISKSLGSKHGPVILAMCQKLDHAKQSATDPLQTSSKRVLQKQLNNLWFNWK